MAAGTTLKHAAGRVARALEKYAANQRWGREDYAIYYRLESDWERAHFIFIAKDFQAQGDFANYVAVRSFLESELSDEPDLLNYLGLVVRSFKQIEEGGIYEIGPEFRAYRAARRRRIE